MVAVAEMRDKLLEVDEVERRLQVTEPIEQTRFSLLGDQDPPARVVLDPVEEDKDEPSLVSHRALEATSNARLEVGDMSARMTNEGLMQLTSAVGLTQKYVGAVPGEMLLPHLDFWLGGRGSGYAKALQALVTGTNGDSVVRAVTKDTIEPFSNLTLFEDMLGALRAEYGQSSDIAVDYKFHHTLAQTAMRLVVVDGPTYLPRSDDEWALGVDFRNSLTGAKTTSLAGYMFRWWCTNGSTSTHATLGSWNRRTEGQDVADVREWIRDGITEITGALDDEFNALETMANEPIEGEVGAALADVFDTYRVPVSLHSSIIDNMVESDDLTMYGVHAAVTQAANEEGMSESQRSTLMNVGGDMIHASNDRCKTCHRLPLDH